MVTSRENQNIASLGGYCEREYVVARGCQNYGVGVFGLKGERVSIDGYVDGRDLVYAN